MDGGFNVRVEELEGRLNELPKTMSPRVFWTYKG
jgi:hypothetical protein